MPLQSFLRSFLSKDKIFYSLFEQVVHELNVMADTLKQLSYETNYENQVKLVGILREKEKANDVLVATLFTELGKNFT